MLLYLCIPLFFAPQSRNNAILLWVVNETSDIANLEQMAAVVRYVAVQSYDEQEVFLGFVRCDSSTSDTALSGKIHSFLQDLGQKQLVVSEQEFRQYVPRQQQFTVHPMSWTCVLLLPVPCRRFGTWWALSMTRTVISIAYSPKHAACLESHLKQFHGTSHSHLVGLCKTRCAACHDALKLFLVVLEPIVDTLDEKSEGHWNQDSTSTTNTLALAIRQFPFVLWLLSAWYIRASLLRFKSQPRKFQTRTDT